MKTSSDEDIGLINSVKEGDASAFRLLVEKYKDVSFSLACSILHNEQDAEDALQESFIKCYKGIKRFQFKSSFSTWLFKIVINTCKTRYKVKQKYNNTIQVESYEGLDLQTSDSASTNLLKDERKRLVGSVLDQLKNDEALVLQLYYLADLNIKEIIEVSGYKESKIKVTLHRARKSFQLLFEKMYGKEMIK